MLKGVGIPTFSVHFSIRWEMDRSHFLYASMEKRHLPPNHARKCPFWMLPHLFKFDWGGGAYPSDSGPVKRALILVVRQRDIHPSLLNHSGAILKLRVFFTKGDHWVAQTLLQPIRSSPTMTAFPDFQHLPPCPINVILVLVEAIRAWVVGFRIIES